MNLYRLFSEIMQSLSELLLGEATIETFSKLEALTLRDAQRESAFGITVSNVSSVIQTRFELFQTVYSDFVKWCDQLKLAPLPIEMLWNLWLPLAIQLLQWRNECQNQRLIQGFLGGQGVGKTTLTAILSLILKQLGCETVSLSIDDLYLPYRDRLELQKLDPRLVRRGPPGTHDIQLGLHVLQQFRQGKCPIKLPRFDKSTHDGAGDQTLPETIDQVDIVLFEGWFVGVRPVDPALFENAPAPILTDSDRQFARDMNDRLFAAVGDAQLLNRVVRPRLSTQQAMAQTSGTQDDCRRESRNE
jgi:D-glycerate 3-kinase